MAAADKTTESQNPVVLADQASDADRLWSISLQARLDEVRAVFQRYPLIAALKATIAAATDDPGWRRVRPPLTALREAQRAELLAALAAHDLP